MGGFIGPALSVGGALLGSSSGGGAPKYQGNGINGDPLNLTLQDTNLGALLNQGSSLLTGANNPYSQLSPQIQQAFSQLFNTPGTAGYNTAAGNAGSAYSTVGGNSVNLSQLLSGAAPQALSAGNSVLNMGLDPQNALYGQQLQKTNDLANITNAQYGLTGQQAAGNVNQADSNFNIDWQNNELQRALSSLSGYDQTLTGVGNAATNSQNVGAAGAGSILSGGATPYTVGQGIGANQETALAQYLSQLLGPSTSAQSQIGDLSGALGLGIDQQSAASSQQLADYYANLTGSAAGAVGGATLGSQAGNLFNTQASGGGLASLLGSTGSFGNGTFAGATGASGPESLFAML